MQEQEQQGEQAVVVEVGQLVVLVVVPKVVEVQVLQEGSGFQPFRVVQLVPSFIQFFQRFVKHRLRKGVCVKSKSVSVSSFFCYALRQLTQNIT